MTGRPAGLRLAAIGAVLAAVGRTRHDRPQPSHGALALQRPGLDRSGPDRPDWIRPLAPTPAASAIRPPELSADVPTQRPQEHPVSDPTPHDALPLQLTREGHVAIVELRRPPLNHFDQQMIDALVDTVRRLDHDETCRAIVLCSQGRHFCAGADFGSGGFATDRVATAERLYRSAAQLFENRVPIIAAVHGAAVGGGLGLACAADFRVADPESRFVANFARLGFHQGFGLSVTLPRIVGRQAAADLLLRAAEVRGEQAMAIGLADRLSAPAAQRAVAIEWAHELAASAPLAVESIRATLRRGLAEEVRSVLERELAEQARLWETADSAEGIAAVAERRTPVFSGR